MSFWAVNWAAEVTLPSMSEKLLLLLLANFADDNDEAWPSIDRLMSMTSASKATIHRLLASLEERGLISRQESRRRTAHGSGFVKGTAIIQLIVPDRVTRRPSSASGARPTPATSKAPSRCQSLTDETLMDQEGLPTDHLSEAPTQPQSLTGETLRPGCGLSGLAGETGRVSLVRLPPTPPYKEEPPFEPPDLTPLPTLSSGGEDQAVSARPVGSAGDASHNGRMPTSEDWAVLRSCLPEAMQALDAPMAAKVSGLLRERLDAGWPARLIRDTLNGNALPLNVHSLGALVAHRVGTIPVDAAPVPQAPAATQRPEPSAGPQFHPAFRVERLRALHNGSPDAQRPTFWWMERYRGASDIPIDVDLETAVRSELVPSTPSESGKDLTQEHSATSPSPLLGT